MENKLNNKFVVAIYDHEDHLKSAVRSLRKAEVEIYDAITPFPVHGLEHEMGLKDTSLHTAGFWFGITGTTVALSFMTWVFTSNYPLNVGGKPFFALPSFIPITFELTVLFASVGMVVTYCVRNKLYPGRIPRIFDRRLTDDKFALTFAVDDKSADEVSGLKNLLQQTHAIEVNDKEFKEEEEVFE